MSGDSGQQDLRADTEQVAASAGELVREWLEELERTGNGVLQACPLHSLEQAFYSYVQEASPQPALDQVLSECPQKDLEGAARLLRARAKSLSSETREEVQVQLEVLSFASSLRTRSFARHGSPEEEGGAASSSPPALRPTELLWHTAAGLRAAKTPGAVGRALAEGAAALCEARGATWWRREGPILTASARVGLSPSDEEVSFRPTRRFWGEEEGRPRGAIVMLSREAPEQGTFLERVHAEQGVLVRLWAGHRWVGALSVQDGVFDEERLDLLAAIAQQAAATLRTIGLEQAREQTETARHESDSGFTLALTSAANTEELLTRICLLANNLASAEACCLFLAEDAARPHLHTLCTLPSAEANDLESDLAAIAVRAREPERRQPLWLNQAKLREAGCARLLEAGYRSALAVALVTREQPFVTLVLLARTGSGFGERVRQELLAFIPQATSSLENMQLFENAQRRLTEMSDLTWVSSRVASTLDPDSIAQTVSRAAADVLGAARVALFLANEEGEFVPVAKGQVGFEEEQTQPLPARGHVGAEVLAAQAARGVNDAGAEGCTEDALVEWMHATSVLCAPMIAPQGLRGLFVVADDIPRLFGLHTVTLLSTYANQAALAFQSALLYQHAVQRLRSLSKLGELSDALASLQDPGQTADLALKTAVELLEAPVGLIWLMDPEANELELKATHGLWPGEWAMQRQKLGEGLAGLAAQSGRPLMSMDITRDGRVSYRREARQKGLGAAIAAPLIARGRTVGVLNLYRKSPERFSEEDKRLLTSVANLAAVSIENANLTRAAQQRTEFVSAMMTEGNHRMRNSLQSVAGLLRMELERPQERSTEEVVRRAIAHVQAVAAVHEVIREQDVPFVDMKEAASRVVRATRGLLQAPSVDIQVTGARVLLPSQKAISVALILNELTDNALRHGLAGRPNGKICISLAEVGGEVLLQVHDNGVGVRGPVDPEEGRGLGLKIVQGLVQELGGTVEFEGRHGFTVRARFSKLQQSRDIAPS